MSRAATAAAYHLKFNIVQLVGALYELDHARKRLVEDADGFLRRRKVVGVGVRNLAYIADARPKAPRGLADRNSGSGGARFDSAEIRRTSNNNVALDYRKVAHNFGRLAHQRYRPNKKRQISTTFYEGHQFSYYSPKLLIGGDKEKLKNLSIIFMGAKGKFKKDLGFPLI